MSWVEFFYFLSYHSLTKDVEDANPKFFRRQFCFKVGSLLMCLVN